MVSFIQNILDRIFGTPKPEDTLPDDGGLAEFAKQYAAQLAEEEKHGKKRGIAAEDVLLVQHGRHGARAYLLDTSDFARALVKELRPSVAPVSEGVLKNRCGEKGSGFMNVSALYAFHIHRDDPIDEYNAALEVIDEIGVRLLGERYVSGERKVAVPVASVVADEIFTKDGKFNVAKAKSAIKMVRENNSHGPVNIDWQAGEAKLTEPPKEWIKNDVAAQTKTLGEWQKQEVAKKEGENKNWEKLDHKKATTNDNWQTIERKAAQAVTQKSWQPIEQAQKEPKTEQEWTFVAPSTKEAQNETADVVPAQEAAAPPKPEMPTKPIQVQPANLRQIGEITLAFHPTWQTKDQAINVYAGFAIRKFEGEIYSGMDLYPQDAEEKTIARIDKALARQALQHLENTKDIDQKTIILPFHLNTLLMEKSRSALKPLMELEEPVRKSVWIEIVGIVPSTSPGKVAAVVQAYQDKFPQIGVRFDLGDISRPMLERTQIRFVSCERDPSGVQARRFGEEVANLGNMARAAKLPLCVWGLRSKEEIKTALVQKCVMLNGRALARDIRKPGKVIALDAGKLLG